MLPAPPPVRLDVPCLFPAHVHPSCPARPTAGVATLLAHLIRQGDPEAGKVMQGIKLHAGAAARGGSQGLSWHR